MKIRASVFMPMMLDNNQFSRQSANPKTHFFNFFLCLRVSDWGCIQIPENAYCFLGLIMVGMVFHPQPSIYGGSILGLPRISLGGLSSSVDGIKYLGSTVF